MFKILKYGIGFYCIVYGYIMIKNINDMVVNMFGEGDGFNNLVLKMLVEYDNVFVNCKLCEKLFIDEEDDF